VTPPSIYDYISIWIYTEQNNTIDLGWMYLNVSSTWKKGYGNITMPWINMRAKFLFKLMVNGSSVAEDVAEFENLNEPLQTHLALTGNDGEMRVMWISFNSTDSGVWYGEHPKKLRFFSSATVTNYSKMDLCSDDARVNFFNPGLIHDAVMKGLEPSKEYYYVVGSNVGWSNEYSFISAPRSSDTVEGIIFGDMGVASSYLKDTEQQYMGLKTAYQVNKIIQKSKTPFVLHIGDIAYARGESDLWEFFFDSILPIATRGPYMVSIGNHEFDYPEQEWRPDWSNYGDDSNGECGVPYFKRFHMPDQTTSKQSGLWYSFNFGPIHFTVMSSEHNFLPGSDQYIWLENDLKSVNRDVTPWLIMTGHRTPYTSVNPYGEEQMILHLRATYEPLFQKYNVDAGFWGHFHHYERFCPMYNGTCKNPGEAPVHVVVGNAGNSYQSPYLEIPNANHYDQPEWVPFRTANFGFGRFIANQTHFRWEMIGDMSGTVHDYYTLTKK
jgi:hypothetical protein